MIAQKPKIRSLTRLKTNIKRTIETALVNKDEVFRMLALAEATGLPLLLIGDPGVAKTKAVLEYAKAWMMRKVDKNNLAELEAANAAFMEKVFILELDEDSKASEVKGRANMQKLVMESVFELDAPITEAEVVIINEVDKGNTTIRNAMLGIMNEHFLFNGRQKIRCQWKLFIATANGIPKNEMDDPFWDRFVLKMDVNRVTAGEMVNYYKQGGRSYRELLAVGVPDKQEIDSVVVPIQKLEKFIKVAYTGCSDRTLTYVPFLAQAATFVWNVSIDKALIKVCSIMVDNNTASLLQDQLLTPTMKQISAKVDMLWSVQTQDQLQTKLDEIGELVQNHAAAGTLNKTEMQEIDNMVSYILDNHTLKEDELLQAALAGEGDEAGFSD